MLFLILCSGLWNSPKFHHLSHHQSYRRMKSEKPNINPKKNHCIRRISVFFGWILASPYISNLDSSILDRSFEKKRKEMSLAILSPEGLRQDGRRTHEVRLSHLRLGVSDSSTTDGSAYFSLGATRVLATVVGPRSKRMSSGAVTLVPGTNMCVSVDMAATTFAHGGRRIRSRSDRLLSSTSEFVSSTLASVVDLPAIARSRGSSGVEADPEMEIAVSLLILAADGGLLAACVTAAGWACADAGVSMRDVLAACQVSVIPVPRATVSATTVVATDVGASDGDASADSGMAVGVLVDPIAREESAGTALLTTVVLLQDPSTVVSMSMEGRLRAAVVPVAAEWAKVGATAIARNCAKEARDYASKRAFST